MITKLGTGNKVKKLTCPSPCQEGTQPRHQMHNSSQLHALLLLPPYPLNRLNGSHRQSGHFGTKTNFLPLLGIKPDNIQPVALSAY